MRKKIVIRVLLIVIFILVLVVIKSYIWHSIEDTYSIKGTVKSVNFVPTRNRMNIYVNFETTDGRIYNFHYKNAPTPRGEAESFNNLTRLTEGDKVELEIYSTGYYFMDSEKKNIAIYVKDVKWLR